MSPLLMVWWLDGLCQGRVASKIIFFYSLLKIIALMGPRTLGVQQILIL